MNLNLRTLTVFVILLSASTEQEYNISGRMRKHRASEYCLIGHLDANGRNDCLSISKKRPHRRKKPRL